MSVFNNLCAPKLGPSIFGARKGVINFASTYRRHLFRLRTMNIRSLTILITFAFAFVVLLSKTQAVSPPPDGGYAGGNTAEGTSTLLSRTTGMYNTAVGIYSLLSLTDGSFCTGVGAGTLLSNTAVENTATGAGALFSHTDGTGNTANGAFALSSHTNGIDNTAVGARALLLNTAGNSNTAIGQAALLNNDTGNNNIAIGVQALGNSTSGSSNIGLGNVTGSAVTTATNVICIGNVGGANVDSTTWISGIWNVNPQSGNTANVVVSDQGQLGVLPSSKRFKKDIQPMNKASESILALKPVKFHYKSDKTDTPQFGLIAEEVAKVNPSLVVHDDKGEVYSVRYDQINAMLLNEFLNEHRKVEQQEVMITELKSKAAKQDAAIADQQKQLQAVIAGLKEQGAQIQKVGAQIEMSKAATQMVLNHP
jgi:trimeric autotransporter adhesin